MRADTVSETNTFSQTHRWTALAGLQHLPALKKRHSRWPQYDFSQARVMSSCKAHQKNSRSCCMHTIGLFCQVWIGWTRWPLKRSDGSARKRTTSSVTTGRILCCLLLRLLPYRHHRTSFPASTSLTRTTTAITSFTRHHLQNTIYIIPSTSHSAIHF